MVNFPGAPTRTLTLVLAESDWRALRAAEPDAVAWLHSQIRERLASPSSESARVRCTPPSASTAESWWGNDDEY
jgi:hypothetical protein